MKAELQPVIFAAGEGSKMFPLTEDIAKCLLPVGNMPMIWYIVNYLDKYGFKEIIVIVRESDESKISHFLQSTFAANMIFDYVTIPNDEEDYGTADSLRKIKNKIKSDILILSCDLFTDAPLNRLVDVHRTYDASLTMMFSKHVEEQVEIKVNEKFKPKHRDPNSGTKDFVSIEPKENRLLYYSNESDLEQDTIKIKKSCLKKYPQMKISSDLVDCHLYIMKKWLVDYLSNYSKPESIKSDFIPHIIQKQFSKPQKQPSIIDESHLSTGDDQSKKNCRDIFSFVNTDELTRYMRDWSGYQGHCLKDQIKCHAYVTDSFCLRVNTLSSYALINKQITKMKDTLAASLELKAIHPSVTVAGKSQIGNGCVVGESTTLNNNVTVKQSIIGKHCVIGLNVRIINCIIMDHVTIDDNSTLQGCTVCNNTTVHRNVKLTSCHVSTNQNIPENADLNNENIVQEEMDFED